MTVVFVVLEHYEDTCYYGDGYSSFHHAFKGVYGSRAAAEEAAQQIWPYRPLDEDGIGYEILECKVS